MYPFELCCADINSVILAEEYGISSIELCVDLKSGGLTPSLEYIRKSRSIFSGELAVLFRLRKGNFEYSQLEKDIMIADMRTAINCGTDTIVFGALSEDHTIDTNFIERVIDHTYGKKLCFHKSFDEVIDFKKSIDILKSFQVDRILTSGLAESALLGKNILKEIVEYAGQQIEITAGGKIDSTNVIEIIQYSGVKRIHGAFLKSNLTSHNYGDPEIASKDKIEKLLSALQNIS